VGKEGVEQSIAEKSGRAIGSLGLEESPKGGIGKELKILKKKFESRQGGGFFVWFFKGGEKKLVRYGSIPIRFRKNKVAALRRG